jgi:hypothetical protein
VPADLPALVGAVTFAQGGRTLTGCEQVPVDASGRMSCTPDSLVGPLYSTFESTNGYAYSRDTVSGVQSIGITPGSATVDLGASASYTVTGYDEDGDSLGDLTSSATLSIAPDGSCTGAVCTPAKAGPHAVTATLDGLEATATLVATQAPSVTVQPHDQSVVDGDDAIFEAAATGYPAPTVQWQRSVDGTWVDIDGATSTTLRLAQVSGELDGTSYRAVFTNSAGSQTSDAATLTVTAAAGGSDGGTPSDPTPTAPAPTAPAPASPVPAATPLASLPRTGPLGDPFQLALLGVLMLAAGAALVTMARARRHLG